MAFGGGFELMRDGDKEGLWTLMEQGIRVQAYTQHVPWLATLLYKLPGMGKAAHKLINFVITQSAARIQRGMPTTGKDLSSHLLDEGSPNPEPLDFDDYCSDAFLALVAGSDTTATVLGCTFFYLLREESVFERLRVEIDASFPFSEGKHPHDDISRLAMLPLLSAVINEALRLQPPVPTGLQRAPEAGSGGRIAHGSFIPEDTGVYIPPYVIHRDERYFSPDPERFWPKRWLSTEKGTALEQAAFIPFSTGPMNCVGKSLALMELRVVVATLVQQFDMRFEDGWDQSKWEEKLEDYFVFAKGQLPVVLKLRT
ncbi:hypothetical protein VNI00_000811 [Paramarasmius palmivorus]|uniref:Cytochrome P450 n=1 Tax=Paramarasmius palmivorus TaxID=297713 RepID=A0AAW0EBF9_9AGAR